MKRLNMKKQRGISLLEVMLSLSIIAVILVMAVKYFGIASSSSRLNQGASEVIEVRQALAQWYDMYGSYTTPAATLDGLKSANLITAQTATGNTPWGGVSLSISVTASPPTITLATFTNTGDCENLAARFSNSGSNAKCTGTTFTYTLSQ